MMRRMILIAAIASVTVMTLAVGYVLYRRSHSRVQELHSLDALRAAFNEDGGKPRLVLLLSPT